MLFKSLVAGIKGNNPVKYFLKFGPVVQEGDEKFYGQTPDKG